MERIVRKIRAVHWRPVCDYPYGMAFRRRAALLVVVCGMVAAAPVSLPLPEAAEHAVGAATAAELQTYVKRLASDEFRGCGVGTRHGQRPRINTDKHG